MKKNTPNDFVFYFHAKKSTSNDFVFIFSLRLYIDQFWEGSEDTQKALAVLVLFAVTLGHEFSPTIHE